MKVIISKDGKNDHRAGMSLPVGVARAGERRGEANQYGGRRPGSIGKCRMLVVSSSASWSKVVAAIR